MKHSPRVQLLSVPACVTCRIYTTMIGWNSWSHYTKKNVKSRCPDTYLEIVITLGITEFIFFPLLLGIFISTHLELLSNFTRGPHPVAMGAEEADWTGEGSGEGARAHLRGGNIAFL